MFYRFSQRYDSHFLVEPKLNGKISPSPSSPLSKPTVSPTLPQISIDPIIPPIFSLDSTSSEMH